MKVIKRMLTVTATVIVFALIILGINGFINNRVVLTKYTFTHCEVPKGFKGYKILMISDLHEAPFAEQIEKYINTEKPDIVVFTGDMVQLPYDSIDETVKLAKAVDNIPIYAISGNHDTQCGAYDKIIQTLWDVNVIPLDNDSVCLEKDGDTILLIGVKDPKHEDVSEEKLKKIRKQIKGEFPDGPCFSILLNHRADMYPEIKDTGADLILSGHLHGGIIRLPFVGGVIGQNSKNIFFPEYDYGFVKEGESAAMIVSGGCDKNPKKKRYFNPPEVVLITLEGE